MGLARRNLMKETVSCSFEKCSQYLTDRAIQLNARFDRRIAQPLVMSLLTSMLTQNVIPYC